MTKHREFSPKLETAFHASRGARNLKKCYLSNCKALSQNIQQVGFSFPLNFQGLFYEH